MAVGAVEARIDRALSAVALDLPVSPELVLVSPPEQAALARELLADRPIEGRSRPRSLAAVAFSVLCAANCLAAFAFSLAVAGY
jgi:hypothetical protein